MSHPDDEENEKEISQVAVDFKYIFKLGVLWTMREVAIHVIQAVWFYVTFRYVLRIEVEFLPFFLIVFLGKWTADSVVTAIDDAVRKDSRKVMTIVERDRIVVNVKDRDNDN